MSNTWSFTTSNSDYQLICQEAASNDELFNVFKQNKRYQEVLEHVSYQAGQELLDDTKDKEFMLDNLEKFRANDVLGGANIQDYGTYGSLSPSTARYIKNAIDIRYEFGPGLTKIVEIGGGYGGLAKTMSVVYKLEKYTVVDIPEVNLLSNKYISNFPELDGIFNTHSCYEYPTITDLDLVISNYALSELNIDGQLEYFDKIIQHAQHFYIIYNFIIPNANENYNIIKDKLSQIFDIREESEREPWASGRIMYGDRR